MSRLNRLAIASLLALAGVASTSNAQLIELNTYQGVLKSGGNNAAGVHQIRFRVYNAASGGALLAEQTRQWNFSTADQGRFTFDDLDFGGVLATGADRWIELSARQGTSGAFTVLGPRQPVTSAPTAQFAEASGTSLNEAYANGNFIANVSGAPVVVRGALQVGSTGTEGFFNLWNGNLNSNDPLVDITTFSDDGGALHIYDENGGYLTVLEADSNDQGMFAQFIGGSSGSLLWDGAAGSGGSGELFISGVSSSSTFNTNVTGNSSVQLPANAISSAEILNEAGAANNQSNSATIPGTGALVTLLSRSITCPTEGYVLAIANADLAINYTGSLVDYMWGVSGSPTTLPANQDMQCRLAGGLPSGTYDFPATASGLFSVTAGAHTFYFNAGGSFGVSYPGQTFFDPQLTLVFIPTAYGAVVSNLDTGEMPADNGPSYAPLNASEIISEQNAEIARHRAEMEAENSEMRRQLAELQAQIDRIVEQQSAKKQ